jgi:hypothetical protein
VRCDGLGGTGDWCMRCWLGLCATWRRSRWPNTSFIYSRCPGERGLAVTSQGGSQHSARPAWKRWGATGSCILLPCLLDPATLRQRLSAQTNNGPDNVLMQRLHFLDATWKCANSCLALTYRIPAPKQATRNPCKFKVDTLSLTTNLVSNVFECCLIKNLYRLI